MIRKLSLPELALNSTANPVRSEHDREAEDKHLRRIEPLFQPIKTENELDAEVALSGESDGEVSDHDSKSDEYKVKQQVDSAGAGQLQSGAKRQEGDKIGAKQNYEGDGVRGELKTESQPAEGGQLTEGQQVGNQQNSQQDSSISLKSQELERIKWQAFEEGKAAAAEEYAKRLEEHEKELAIASNAEVELYNVCNAIKQKLDTIDQQLAMIFSKWSDQCLILSHGIACKVIEEVSKVLPIEIVANYLHKRLPALREELTIDVEVNPEQLAAVEQKMKEDNINSALKQDCSLRFIANPALLPGDCSVKVDGGSFLKDQKQMLKEIEDVLQNYLVHSSISKQKQNK